MPPSRSRSEASGSVLIQRLVVYFQVLAAATEGLANQRRRVLPKSPFGEAVTNVTNQWSVFGVYLTDAQLTIDNTLVEQAIRPLAGGRQNRLHIAGDGGLGSTAIILSVTASVKRHRIHPWAFLRHALTEVPAHPR